MGSARGVSGVAMNTSIMEQVPQHFMGRVQNTFYFAGTFLQIILGISGRRSRAMESGGGISHHRYGLCSSVCQRDLAG